MNNSKGFTLIELVMVITLLGIIAGIVALPLYQGTMGWFQATTRETITESGRIGIERMTREIRNTGRTAANNPCISTATATSFTFSDMNGDLANCNSITFDISGTDIRRSGVSLADNVLSLDINYYNSSNGLIARPVSAANLLTIRRVSIEIVSTRGGETLRKYTEVYLSNMKGY